MTTNVRTAESGTDSDSDSDYDPRPRYIRLGVDAEGRHHIYATRTERIHVIDADGGRSVRPLCGHPVETWMADVADHVGWAVERYGRSLAECITVEGVDD